MCIDRIHQLLLLIKENTGQTFKFMHQIFGYLICFILLLHDIDRYRLKAGAKQMQCHIDFLPVFQIREIL